MFTKTFIFIIMIIILVALASGLIFLVKDEGKTNRTARALTWRIALSLGLFLFLILAFSLEWVSPHGL